MYVSLYFGAIANKPEGQIEEYMKRELGKASGTFFKLGSIDRNSSLGKNTRIGIFKSYILAVLLYDSGIWHMTTE